MPSCGNRSIQDSGNDSNCGLENTESGDVDGVGGGGRSCNQNSQFSSGGVYIGECIAASIEVHQPSDVANAGGDGGVSCKVIKMDINPSKGDLNFASNYSVDNAHPKSSLILAMESMDCVDQHNVTSPDHEWTQLVNSDKVSLVDLCTSPLTFSDVINGTLSNKSNSKFGLNISRNSLKQNGNFDKGSNGGLSGPIKSFLSKSCSMGHLNGPKMPIDRDLDKETGVSFSVPDVTDYNMADRLIDGTPRYLKKRSYKKKKKKIINMPEIIINRPSDEDDEDEEDFWNYRSRGSRRAESAEEVDSYYRAQEVLSEWEEICRDLRVTEL